MAITHGTATRNTLADAVVDQLDGGTIEIQDSGGVVLATFTLPTPAFGAAASGTATGNSVSNVTASANGTASQFEAFTSGAVLVFAGSVTATGNGGDATINSTSIASGAAVAMSSLSYSAPP